MLRKIFTTCIFLFIFFSIYAQKSAAISGIITDESSGNPIDFATVYIKEINKSTETSSTGYFRIRVPAEKPLTVILLRVSFDGDTLQIQPLSPGEEKTLNHSLTPTPSELGIEVTEQRERSSLGMVTADVEALKLLPTTSGNLESALPHIALGASSGTGGELSSQYNVRGGNYDENLVYVNDFAIYRPQLIRTGQQEGLTFPNIDLIQSLSFSSGGFEAKYGDKLSSVLDVKYKRPEELKGSAEVSLLGASAHIEGSIKLGQSNFKKIRFLFGARYKTTAYILSTLDIEGENIPNFYDIQGYITYDINRDWQLGIIGNYNRSEYTFIPQTRSTALGLIDFALELFTVFEGQEVDDFTTNMGGVSLTYTPDRNRNPFFLKFMGSAYQSNENERFDILGFYRLGQVESDLGSDDFGEVVSLLGTGTQQQFVRNYLTSNVVNLEHRGGIELQLDPDDWQVTSSHFLQWGVKYQREEINDELNEWERLDSAGYSLPYDPNEVLIQNVLKTENNLLSNRFSGFIQNTYSHIKDSVSEFKFSAGVRAAYWDLNNEFIVSPRVQFLYKPLKFSNDISFRLASGLYFQPPFYRELRNLQGEVNTDLKSQKSVHVVGGLTWDFNLGKMSTKKFRFIAEAYYKHLWDLVSYDVDNVRIRYSGENDATGYVAGIDLRLNGEFVPGAESWFNLSFLRARESLNGVQHLRREIGDAEAQELEDVPRPTDQFMTFSVFFQDYLPKNENFKMHLNFTVGTGLPYGLKDNNRVFRNTYRFSPYHRVDIGFSFQLYNQDWADKRPNHFLKFTRSAWVRLEVFNLMQVSNAASNTWIKTIYNTQYAVPNFLTSRRINVRLRVEI